MGVLWIYGPTGSGKTHRVQALVQKKETEGKRVLVLTSENLSYRLLDLLRRRQKNALDVLVAQFLEIDTLVVEEMEGLLYKAATEEVIEEVIVRLNKQGKDVVCTSLCPPSTGSSLLTLSDFEVVKMQWPDFEERKHIVDTLCRELALSLSREEKEALAAGTQHAGQIRGELFQKMLIMLQNENEINRKKGTKYGNINIK